MLFILSCLFFAAVYFFLNDYISLEKPWITFYFINVDITKPQTGQWKLKCLTASRKQLNDCKLSMWSMDEVQEVWTHKRRKQNTWQVGQRGKKRRKTVFD